MISAVQNAKRNELKNSLKSVFVILTFLGILFGTALGVMWGSTFTMGHSIYQSPAFIPLIFGSLVLIAIAWHYAKKIDQL